jgi:amino acid adenylation domain-containing protein/thioester reductase-like protein
MNLSKQFNSDEIEMYNIINNTKNDSFLNHTIPQAFKEIVKRYPKNIAISSEVGSYTYKELDLLSNQLANLLIKNGINKGDFIGIFMDRSLETIISLLGILKSGGAYVSIDTDYPDERIQYIISDTKCSFILTKTNNLIKLHDTLNNNSYTSVIINVQEDIFTYSQEDVVIDLVPSDLAYILYTSGSTGDPKGVLIEHNGVVNLAKWLSASLSFTSNDVLTQFFTYNFDASILDTFGSLLSGSKLHLLPNDARVSVEKFINVIYEIKASHIILPMVFFNQLSMKLNKNDFDKLSTVKSITVGGERLLYETVRIFKENFPHIHIINSYGPTESTVVSTDFKISKLNTAYNSGFPIGKPIANTKVYILDYNFNLCSINEPGELYIDAIGLARGYLNKKDKTEQSFIENPFVNKINNKLYKTGDIVKLLSDGNIQFLGRKDAQVKISGHRIEIGEIESVVKKYPCIQDLSVIVQTDKENGNILVLFYTTDNSIKIENSLLRKYLLSILPSYMIPKYMHHLEKMPLNPNGKIDIKALQKEYPAKYLGEINLDEKPNFSEMQSVIIHAWEKVLSISQINIMDDFFEIGGHSFDIIKVLTLLKPYFPELTIQDFFECRTIYRLENRIKKKQIDKLELIANNTKYHSNKVYRITESPIFKLMDNITEVSIDTSINNVLLTGATGYLGSHILYDLVENTDAHIYCIVRPLGDTLIYNRLIETLSFYFDLFTIEKIQKRITLISGDFEQINLGIDNINQKLLQDNIDTIIHCGADVRHFGESSYFNKVNVDSTKYLLEFIQKNNNIRLHYVSSIGVPEELHSSGQWDTFDSNFNNVYLDNVYLNSKLNSEKLLFNAIEKGLPVTIYRVGNLIGHSQSGLFQKNIDINSFYRLIKAILLIGKAPISNYYIDLTPVDFASKSLIELIKTQKTVGRIFHICNPNQISFTDMIKTFNSIGYKVDLLEYQEYYKYLFSEGNSQALELLIHQIDSNILFNFSSYVFDCSNVTNFLKNNIICPKPDQSLIKKLIDYAYSIEYFPNPN